MSQKSSAPFILDPIVCQNHMLFIDFTQHEFELTFSGRPYEGFVAHISNNEMKHLYEDLKEYFEQQENEETS